MWKRKVKLLPTFFVFAVLFTLCCYIKYTDIKIKALTVKTDAYCRVYEDARESSEPVTLIQYAAPFSYGLQYPRTGQDYVDERIIQIVNKIRADFDEKYRHQKISRSSDNTLLRSDRVLKIYEKCVNIYTIVRTLIYIEGRSVSRRRGQTFYTIVYRKAASGGFLYIIVHKDCWWVSFMRG